MSPRLFVLLITSLSLLALVSGVVFMASHSPIYPIQPLQWLYLGLCVWFSLGGAFTVLIGSGRYLIRNRRARGNVFRVYRQAMIASAVAVLYLALRFLDVLSWWEGGLLIVGAVLLELFFQTERTPFDLHHSPA